MSKKSDALFVRLLRAEHTAVLWELKANWYKNRAELNEHMAEKHAAHVRRLLHRINYPEYYTAIENWSA